ncbi:hypothetical protein ABEB36_014594 [Hypothenemus hampei]|uniref:Regulatory protein zeste n=1 Tax=Hypothenemus hampei TaxID=57062 RepID=A0ABD1E291_HYPHA
MSSKQVVFDRKMQWIMKIKENKDIVFGAFSENLRKEHKINKWKELATLAQSICLMPLEKNWTYARDTLWQNIKKMTMLKLDNAKKTGTGGLGKMSEIDKTVLEIIGKDSPVVCGLGVKDSMNDTLSQCETQVDIGHHRENENTIKNNANPSVTPKKCKTLIEMFIIIIINKMHTDKRRRITIEDVCDSAKKEKNQITQ